MPLQFLRRLIPLTLVLLTSIFVVSPAHAYPRAQAGTRNPVICYAISDEPDARPEGDHLVAMNRTTGAFTDIGDTGTVSAETMAVNLAGNTLYTINHVGTEARFGTLNLDPGNGPLGAFQQIGVVGSGNNAVLGVQDLQDFDTMFWDSRTGYLWAITQSGPSKAMIRIDPATGHPIPNVFGPGFDYAAVDLSPVAGADNIDDLAVDPFTGRFYIIANSSNGINDHLARININGVDPASSSGFNPATGIISITLVGALTNTAGGGVVNDVEGLSAFNDGTFYATTGAAGNPANSMWTLNVSTAQLTLIATFPQTTTPPIVDTEAVGCLTAGSNVVTGTVFLDNNGNGVFDAGDTVIPNVTVRFYIDTNNNGVVDAGDTLIQTKSTDGNGFYSFETANAGGFVMDFDQTDPDLPPGFTLTTPAVQNADFVNNGTPFSEYGNTDPNNNFGVRLPAAPTPTPSPTPSPSPTVPAGVTPGATLAATAAALIQTAPMITKQANPPFALPGVSVTWTITVTNPSPSAATSLVVSDTMPNEIEIRSVSSNVGTVSVNGQTITLTLARLESGGVITITVLSRVRPGTVVPYVLQNKASLTNAENPDPRYAIAQVASVSSLPATGEKPFWRTLVLGLMIAAGLAGLWMLGKVLR